MSGSGFGIQGIENTRVPQRIQYVLTCQAPIVSSEVVAGTTVRGTRVSPTAAGSSLPSGASTLVFVFCEPSLRAVSSRTP